jgi:hypothetical protein
MYGTQAVSRPEITAFLEHAHGVDDYFIAQKLFPVKGMKARAGRFPVIKMGTGKLMRRDNTARNSGGSYNEVTRSHEWDSYDCKDRGLEERIDDSKAAEMKSFFDMETMTGKLVRRQVALDFEVRAKETLIDENVFAKENAVIAYTNALIDTVDAPQDIEAAIEAIISRGETANTLVLSLKLWNYLRRSKLMQAYVWGKLTDSTGKRQLTANHLKEVFDFDTVHITKSHIDTSKSKDKTVVNPIWGVDYMWIGCVKGGDFSEGGVGRTLTWDADSPGGLFSTETYRDEATRSDKLRVRSNSIEKIVNEHAGQLIKTNSTL